MSLPIVAVVGRPNVGKSTFVNRIVGGRDAIVHEQRGVTRDRSYHQANWNGRDFTLIDTGGIEMESTDTFIAPIRAQAQMAMEEADAVVFLVDGTVESTADDLAVARMLKKSEHPVILAVNKMDNPGKEEAIWEYYSLGLGTPWPISSVHGHGTGDLLDELVQVLPAVEDTADDGVEAISVAIIGRPNAGKSTLTNRLAGFERSIVSDVAGTTRDAVDTLVGHGDKTYRLVDTAGLRRLAKVDESVEYFGYVRALRAIDRADVALLLVDSTLGLTDQDQRVASIASERGCAMIVLLNKWDAVEDPDQRQLIRDHVEDRLVFVSYAPVIAVSALTGRSVHRIWNAIDKVYESYSRKIGTGRLNRFLAEIRDFGHTVSKGKIQLRMNYVTQTDTCPPHFTFFVNAPALVDDNYRRYLENRLRETFDLEGTPIFLHFKKKDGTE